MKKAWLLTTLFLLVSCATLKESANVKSPEIDRLSEAALQRIMPKPVSQLSFEALSAMSQEGLTVDAMIASLQKSNAAFDLTPSQILALNKQGIAIKVLDYLHESRLKAMQNNVASLVNETEKNKNQALKQQKLELMQQSLLGDPFCRGAFPRFYPYGVGGHLRFGNPWYY